MKTNELPTFDECAQKIVNGEATALHRFIHDNEPAGNKDARQFRSQLAALITEVSITKQQKCQFNLMLESFKRIANYQTTEQLRKNSEKEYGLDYEEALEMAYENIKMEAFLSSSKIKLLKID